MKLIDTHCHLSDKKYTDLDLVVNNFRNSDIELVFVPSVDLVDARKVLELVSIYDDVYGFIGIHPEHADEVVDIDASVAEINGMLNNKKILGIGEIGIDCHWKQDNIEKQTMVFRKQLVLATLRSLPVVVHSRNAGDVIEQLFMKMDKLPRGQFHCFGESESFLRLILEKGFYVSFTGNITYPNAESLRNLVKLSPLERLLIETDGPYLSPQSLRGRLNVPENVRIVAEEVAKIKGIEIEEVINQTNQNAKCLFLDI